MSCTDLLCGTYFVGQGRACEIGAELKKKNILAYLEVFSGELCAVSGLTKSYFISHTGVRLP